MKSRREPTPDREKHAEFGTRKSRDHTSPLPPVPPVEQSHIPDEIQENRMSGERTREVREEQASRRRCTRERTPLRITTQYTKFHSERSE